MFVNCGVMLDCIWCVLTQSRWAVRQPSDVLGCSSNTLAGGSMSHRIARCSMSTHARPLAHTHRYSRKCNCVHPKSFELFTQGSCPLAFLLWWSLPCRPSFHLISISPVMLDSLGPGKTTWSGMKSSNWKAMLLAL